ncbi:MAG: hypothetical protein PHD00_05140 [Bacteroidales bacterium]|nr:hypothetical protein [Bacteroidales bacterium]
MKLAIHKRSGSFSDRWINYCEGKGILYKIVNCYDSDIIEQLVDCDGLMWHWSHMDYRAQNFARQLIFSIESKGIKVFPSYSTCWHFDDKVGQKYLLESINAPFVSTYIFYNKKDAISFAQNTYYPKVFKLRGGAGSQNVKLIRNKRIALRLIRKAFNRGFPLTNKYSNIKQRLWVLKRDKTVTAFIHLIKDFVRIVMPKERHDLLPRQKGYVYFQDFIPQNEFDDRVIVIGEKAIAIRRYNRKDDFRASGSGLIEYKPDLFSDKIIEIAFRVSKSIRSQSTAFDFIYDNNGKPLIVEISYAYAQGPAYDKCPGCWDKNLKWHNEHINPQKFIIENFIKEINGNG